LNSFFDQQAGAYHRNSSRGPWRWLRNREQACVLRHLGAFTGNAVLDLGSGAGFYSRLALEHGAHEVVSVDLSRKMIEALPTDRMTGVVGDASTVSLNKRFKTIVMAGLLEFTASPPDILANARKHAETGAVMAILAPRNNIWGWVYRVYHRNHGIKISLFSRGQLKNLAMDEGWQYISGETVWPFSIIMGFRAIQ
jgi:cyclopropane fatty-acyl-phospholipid synthase-like methyltransferase